MTRKRCEAECEPALVRARVATRRRARDAPRFLVGSEPQQYSYERVEGVARERSRCVRRAVVGQCFVEASGAGKHQRKPDMRRRNRVVDRENLCVTELRTLGITRLQQRLAAIQQRLYAGFP